MSDPKVTKPKLADTSNKPGERVKPLKVRETTRESDLNVPCSVRGNRTVSCSRRPQRERSDTAPNTCKVALGSQRRTRAASTAPKLITQRCDAKPGNKKSRIYDKQTTAETKCSQQRAQGQHQLPSTSHTVFTVITPDPKKRLKIQKKAEEELIALEDLRVSKTTTYVSINPSTVGGCLSLEEVRQRQQQEMTQAKRKPKQIKEHLMVPTR
ncbi:uncharacterized protein zgc:194621 [Periophthalmus magnuspinnatus]|uniref:uncharacterized protein zgc:194621 n=1 Tax=Periophthalmus magnuspinnatus TaxID=409849 RepID=UPI002436493A|nr:uncharacterized protein zgc:194621 [Periophthalmus magnuspinnatus]